MDAYATTVAQDESFALALAECALYPEQFPGLVYPWGEPGHRLEHKTLRGWQRGFLHDLGQQVRARNFDPFSGKGNTTVAPLQFSTSSGHGIGKSALVAMLVHWIHFCWPDSRVIVTANTQGQLKSRTWAAVGEWMRMSKALMSISTYLTSQGHMVLRNNQRPESWDAIAATAQAGQEESLQGQHSPTISALIVDEASALRPEVIKATRGAMAGGMGLMALFGNPTRNSGPFYDSHHGQRELWVRRKIDSRDVEDTDGPLFEQWVEELGGVDSDEYRVRVRGEFPMTSELQFIPGEFIEHSFNTTYVPTERDPLIFGCDIAHTGSDSSVLIKRWGDKVLADIMASPSWRVEQFEEIIIKEALDNHPDAIFVDGEGVGAGVPGHLRERLDCPIYEVRAGSMAGDPRYANVRAECWGRMKEALRIGIDLPTAKETRYANDLRDDLTACEFKYTITGNKIQLERKEEAKKRGVASPDFGDALSFTYKHPIALRGDNVPFVGHVLQGIVDPDPNSYVLPVPRHPQDPRRRPQRGGMASPINPRWRA